MTAIFAYAKDDISFIAADSRRGILPTTEVLKVHQWSEHILIAQTGDGPAMTKLIHKMLEIRDNCADQTTDLPTLTSIFKIKTLGKNICGKFVVAVASHGQDKAQIQTFDCCTRQTTTVGNLLDIYADGTSQPIFQNIADYEFQKMLNSGHPIPLDIWAVECIKKAKTQAPDYVDFPATLAITRPIAPSMRRCIIQKVPSAGVFTQSSLDFLAS